MRIVTLKFEFRIIDESTGDTIASDWTTIDPRSIDCDGGCETVDIHVASALRAAKREMKKRAAIAEEEASEEEFNNSQFGVGA